ncbi:MAG: YibE/F family protein [Kineosporiaceae bacterium]
MSVILYLVHGFSNRTTTALFWTLAGIWVTAGLAARISAAAHLNGLTTKRTSPCPGSPPGPTSGSSTTSPSLRRLPSEELRTHGPDLNATRTRADPRDPAHDGDRRRLECRRRRPCRTSCAGALCV